MLSKSFIVSFAGLLLLTFTVCAGGSSALEGIVKDPAGRPVKGADVRIEAKNFSKIVKTDAKGHYVCDGLGVATYKVSLLINGQVKASIANAKTHSGKPAQLNFNLTGQTASAKEKTHWVYVRPDVDTHIGGVGRWVELDENGNVVNNATNTGASSNVTSVAAPSQQGQGMQIRVQAGHSF
jgi:hypothetical protein